MKKIKYKLLRNEANNPRLETSSEFSMLWELGSMSSEYVRNIVQALEEVKSGERESYDFGYVSSFIQCYKVGHEKFSGQAFIDYDYGEQEMEIDFDNIYNLMRDWRDYLNEWEKETGLVKK